MENALTHNSTRSNNIRPKHTVAPLIFDDSHFRLFLIRPTSITCFVMGAQILHCAVLHKNLINVCELNFVINNPFDEFYVPINNKLALLTFDRIRELRWISRNVMKKGISAEITTISLNCRVIGRVIHVRKCEPTKYFLSSND